MSERSTPAPDPLAWLRRQAAWLRDAAALQVREAAQAVEDCSRREAVAQTRLAAAQGQWRGALQPQPGGLALHRLQWLRQHHQWLQAEAEQQHGALQQARQVQAQVQQTFVARQRELRLLELHRDRRRAAHGLAQAQQQQRQADAAWLVQGRLVQGQLPEAGA